MSLMRFFRRDFDETSLTSDCLKRIEKHFDAKLVERYPSCYVCPSRNIIGTLDVSKGEKRDSPMWYWFPFSLDQRQFLEQKKEYFFMIGVAFAGFGCGDSNMLPVVQADRLLLWIDKGQFKFTENKTSPYWDIIISNKSGKPTLHKNNGEEFDLSWYLID